jgi:hypothetical protein
MHEPETKKRPVLSGRFHVSASNHQAVNHQAADSTSTIFR